MTDTQNHQTDEVVDIQTVEQFAVLANRWHQGMIARLRNLLEIPFGTGVSLEEPQEDGTVKTTEVKLKGDAMKGYQVAMNTALSELGNFPFVLSVEEPDETGKLIATELRQSDGIEDDDVASGN